jgi:hypothetical protein
MAPTADLAISLERDVVRLSEEHLGDAEYYQYAARQLESSRQLLFGTRPIGDRRGASDQTEIRRWAESACEILGIPYSSIEGSLRRVTRTMVGCTPALRWQLVFRDEHDADIRWSHELERVPHIMAGLLILAAVAGASGMVAVTYQTLSRLLRDYRELLTLLAYSNCAMAWRRNGDVPSLVESERRPLTVYATASSWSSVPS